MKEGIREFSKYFLIGIVILLLFLSYKIIEPYIIVLISAFVISFIIFPLYSKLSKHVGETFSALICIFLVSLIIILPIGAITTQLSSQAYSAMNEGNLSGFLDKLSSNQIFEKYNINISELVKSGTNTTLSLIARAASYLPSLLISFMILLFSIFFMLVRWEHLSKEIREFIPFNKRENMIREISHTTHEILNGYLLIALIDFMVAAIGFYILGITPYLFLAFIIAVLAFIPGLGSIVVTLPFAIYYYLIGNITGLVGIIILGAILIFGIEMFLANWLLSSKARISPLIMLIGILGGTMVFGLFGFVIGPLVLAYTIKITKELIKN